MEKPESVLLETVKGLIGVLTMIILWTVSPFGWMFIQDTMAALPPLPFLAIATAWMFTPLVGNYLYGLACGLKIETMGNWLRVRIGLPTSVSSNKPMVSKPFWLNLTPGVEWVFAGMKHRHYLHWMFLTITDTNFRLKIEAIPGEYPRTIKHLALFVTKMRQTADMSYRWSKVDRFWLTLSNKELRFTLRKQAGHIQWWPSQAAVDVFDFLEEWWFCKPYTRTEKFEFLRLVLAAEAKSRDEKLRNTLLG